jgi:hypothetical protein
MTAASLAGNQSSGANTNKNLPCAVVNVKENKI